MPENIRSQSLDQQSLPLFRNQAITARSDHFFGPIRTAQPLSAWLVACASSLIASGLIAFIVLGSVTKKARVSGITVPVGGSITIIAPNTGLLAHALLAEGQFVNAGQTLFELSTERQGRQGEIAGLVEQQLIIRQHSLDTERRARRAQDNDKRTALAERLRNNLSEMASLEQEISLAKRRLGMAQQTVEKFQLLQASGYVSQAQTQQKQEEHIDLDLHITGLERAKAQLQANRLTLEAEHRALKETLAADLAQLVRSEASLQQELIENQNRKTTLITAPQPGVLTTITYHPGQVVNAGQALATLIPTTLPRALAPDALEVHLFAPSRTAGFVQAGQPVLIRYQSYPYQKFGLVARGVKMSHFAQSKTEPLFCKVRSFARDLSATQGRVDGNTCA
ncbi:HlyD family secretion protein, partial [Pseudoduganella ginsengisoli]